MNEGTGKGIYRRREVRENEVIGEESTAEGRYRRREVQEYKWVKGTAHSVFCSVFCFVQDEGREISLWTRIFSSYYDRNTTAIYIYIYICFPKRRTKHTINRALILSQSGSPTTLRRPG